MTDVTLGPDEFSHPTVICAVTILTAAGLSGISFDRTDYFSPTNPRTRPPTYSVTSGNTTFLLNCLTVTQEPNDPTDEATAQQIFVDQIDSSLTNPGDKVMICSEGSTALQLWVALSKIERHLITKDGDLRLACASPSEQAGKIIKARFVLTGKTPLHADPGTLTIMHHADKE